MLSTSEFSAAELSAPPVRFLHGIDPIQLFYQCLDVSLALLLRLKHQQGMGTFEAIGVQCRLSPRYQSHLVDELPADAVPSATKYLGDVLDCHVWFDLVSLGQIRDEATNLAILSPTPFEDLRDPAQFAFIELEPFTLHHRSMQCSMTKPELSAEATDIIFEPPDR